MLLVPFQCPLGEAAPSRISQELRNLGSKRKILAKNPFPADSSRSFSSLEFLPIRPQAGSPKGTVACRERPWMRPEFREAPSSRRAKPPLKGSKSSGKAGISPGYQSQRLPSLLDSSRGRAGSGSFPFFLLLPTPGFDLFPLDLLKSRKSLELQLPFFQSRERIGSSK